ncbi:dehydrogenase/reductase SDR family member 4-like [Anthonomus grandis grandis]|uniref:dehydrogenase/reductase SDR family member 4-like n=1 Tax=Anthonomus grandis grandis TaxID=2921223 RepID=UPI0021658EB7|nr:dehydrogenase/reductase SDR family member 4-like [Anthonomus grandis grandis]
MLANRVAIVTASTDGIGLAIARRLGQEGASLVISSRKPENVERATKELQSEGLRVKSLVCHVSDAENRKKLFEEAKSFGGLDILVSNAAVNPVHGGILDCSESIFDKIYDVNVKSSFLLAKEALPLLRKSKHGRIIFISSISAYYPHILLGAYGFSKTALLGLTKNAALQLAPEGITVNCICPGHIETRFSKVMRSSDDMLKEELTNIPMGRIGKSEEVASSVAFLASDDASYITGENLLVSGGFSARL